MSEHRYVLESSSYRPNAPVNDDLKRLVEQQERVAALLRAGRRPRAQASGYRSSYAARLWALAHAEWSEADGSRER